MLFYNVVCRSLPLLLAVGITCSQVPHVEAKESNLRKTAHGSLKPLVESPNPMTASSGSRGQKADLPMGFLAKVEEKFAVGRRDGGPPIYLGFFLVMMLCALACQGFAYSRSKGEPLDWDEGVSDASAQDAYGKSLTLKQQWEAVELIGIEAKNRYVSEDPPLFIHEKSDGIQRVLASANRELTLFAHAGARKSDPGLLRMYKPYHLTGCECCCAPEMHMDLPNGKKLGRIQDPFDCCEMNQQIEDENSELRFQVSGSRCQPGMCCCGVCCVDTTFQVTDKEGNAVGEIVKPALKFDEVFLKTNRFIVDFPEQCSMDDKALLVGSAMLLDLQYFDVKN